MRTRKPSRSRRKRVPPKSIPPIGMIVIGAMILIIGFAAFFALPKEGINNFIQQEEYSSIPMPVEYPAPELELVTMQGDAVSLADYRGQVVLLNLWATWCPPCKEELPVLEAYYKNHRDEGFVIIGVEDGQPVEEVEAYIKTTGVTYPIWIDHEYATEIAFSAFSLPSSFVIDREGTVRLSWVGVISTAMLEKHITPLIEK